MIPATKFSVRVVRYEPNSHTSAAGWSRDFAPDDRGGAESLYERLERGLDAMVPQDPADAERGYRDRAQHARVTIQFTEHREPLPDGERQDSYRSAGYVIPDPAFALATFDYLHALLGNDLPKGASEVGL